MSLHDGSPIRAPVVGVGSFARNHARVYHELQKQGAGVQLIGVVDADIALAQEIARQFDCLAFSNIEELRGRIDAASVAVPTVHHLSVAAALMASGVDGLIEKPRAPTLQDPPDPTPLAPPTPRPAPPSPL